MLTALGDSIIKGVVLSNDTQLTGIRRYQVSSQPLTERCAQLLHTDIINLGKFGCTAPAGLKIAEHNAQQIAASTSVLIEYGGNDSNYCWPQIAQNPHQQHLPYTTIHDFVNAYQSILAHVIAVGSIPIMLSLPPMDADKYFHFFSQGWNDTQKENVLSWLGGSTSHISTGHELYNIATHKIAKQANVKIIDITSSFLAERNYSDFLCEDGIHPNELGQSRIADIIANELG